MILKSADRSTVDSLLDAIKAATGGTENPEGQMPEDITEDVTVDETADELAKANERIAELEAALAAATVETEITEGPEDDEDLLKSVPEAVRKMLDDQRTAAADALAKAAAIEEELRKERDARADEAAIAKAAAWSSLTVDPKEIGPALRRVADVDADLAKAIETALESANAQAESAGIFAEIGKAGRPDAGDAYGALESLAKAAVDAGTAATFEQAFVKVAEQNPDLYIRHLNEKGA